MKKWVAFFLVLGLSTAYAATGGHGEHGGEVHVPKSVLYQTINVLILFGGLFYFLKDTIVKFYRDRKGSYLAAAQKSQAAREEAEKQLSEMQQKLKELESSKDASLARAKVEAAELKSKMVSDAQEIAARISREAEQTAKIEVQKAQNQLREQLLKDSLDAAKAVLAKDIGSADHQKLQSEFVNKVQAVNP